MQISAIIFPVATYDSETWTVKKQIGEGWTSLNSGAGGDYYASHGLQKYQRNPRLNLIKKSLEAKIAKQRLSYIPPIIMGYNYWSYGNLWPVKFLQISFHCPLISVNVAHLLYYIKT